MKASTVLALAVAGGAQFAAAHTTVWNVLVNGKDQGVGNTQGGYIDSPPNNSPVKDVTSQDVQCNVANVKATRSVTVAGGDEVIVQWHHDSNSGSDDIIDPSHKGPILNYISKAGSSMSWTKISQDGYDGSQWAISKLQTGAYTGTPGQHKVKIPNLVPGDYVLRPELIALHEGDRIGGAQLYMECIHLKVTGSGTASLPAGVSFPGAYKATDAGIHFDIYNGFSSYPLPGPAVWNGASSGAAPAPVVTKAPTTTKAPAATAKPVTVVTKTTLATVAKPTATAAAGGATAQKYGQCGGQGFTGAKSCPSGWTCKVSNPYYSQCLQ